MLLAFLVGCQIHAEEVVCTAQQGSERLTSYVFDFLSHANHLDWLNNEMTAAFRQGPPHKMPPVLQASCSEAITLQQYITAAQQVERDDR